MDSHLRIYLPQFLLFSSSLGCILISIWSLQTGYTIIFQNLYYIPIILACVLYTRRGFLFSCLLSLIYLSLMTGYTQDSTTFFYACIRVILFASIAGVVTFLAESGRKSEEALRLLSGFQENIITNARVWLMVLDQKGTIYLWNTAAEEMSGYHAEEVIGKNEIWKLLYPAKNLRLQITRTITRIISEENYLANFETTIRTKAGDERIISWNTKGIPEKTGERSKYIAIGVDVTDRHLAEQKLLESEERFRLVFENLPLGLWMADKNGRLLLGNPAGQRIWGGEPHFRQEGHGLCKAWRYPSHEEIQGDDWALGYAIHEGRVTDSELLEIEATDGTHKFILNWAAPVKNARGEIAGAFVINQDFTRNKRDEEELKQRNEDLLSLTEVLRESEEELQAQLEEIRSSQDMLQESEERWSDLFTRNLNAIAIYRVVDEGKDFVFVDFNPAGESIERINRDEIIGKRVTEVFPGVEKFGLLAVFRRVSQTGTPENHEISFYTDDRVQGWRENLVFRLSSGEIVAMYSDVTERKRDEELIRETNAYLNNLISIANVPILIWDRSFRITRLNHACEELIGRSIEEVVGNSLTACFPLTRWNARCDSFEPRSKESGGRQSGSISCTGTDLSGTSSGTRQHSIPLTVIPPLPPLHRAGIFPGRYSLRWREMQYWCRFRRTLPSLPS